MASQVHDRSFCIFFRQTVCFVLLQFGASNQGSECPSNSINRANGGLEVDDPMLGEKYHEIQL